MARTRYRANITPTNFPLLSSFAGQTTILAGIDQAFLRGNSLDHQEGIPQVFFLENVMPMSAGLQSVGFLNGVVGGFSQDFDKAFYLRDSEERRTLFVPANGKNYFWDDVNFVWRQQNLATPFGTFVTAANIKARQFVCFAFWSAFYEWDGAVLNEVEFTGLEPTAIKGIVAANAYLVAYTRNEIFWSSTLLPTDFTPSLASTAGATDILSLKGDIVCCTPISDGFIIYTTSNIIVAQYTGNARFPWTFKEVAGSTGIDDPERVTDGNSDISQYAATIAGIFALNRTQALPIFPEVSEFLAGRRYETYNASTKQIVEHDINDALLVKVNFIAERYLVISYGDNELTHALVYDTALKRWGKIAVPHVDCFDWISRPTATVLGPGIRYQDLSSTTYIALTQTYFGLGHMVFGPPIRYIDLVGTYQDQFSTYEGFGGVPLPGVYINNGQEPYKAIGFLQKNGSVKVLNFDLPAIETDTSVLFLGSYQMSRGRFTDLHEIVLENLTPEQTTRVSTIGSFDGFNREAAIPAFFDKSSRGRQRRYLTDIPPFMNALVRIDGNFDLSSVEMTISPAGYR